MKFLGIYLPIQNLREYIIQQIISSNCAGYLAEVMQRLFDIHRQEVRGHQVIYSF